MTTIVAIFLILHGLVHAILALVPDLHAPEEESSRFFFRSWLLSRLGLSESVAKPIAIILTAIATIGFIATGLALLDLLVPFDWWRNLAIASAAVSLLLYFIFWHRYLIAGIVIDFAILVSLIFFNWTPD